MRRTERFAKLVRDDPKRAASMMSALPVWHTPDLMAAALNALHRRIAKLEKQARRK